MRPSKLAASAASLLLAAGLLGACSGDSDGGGTSSSDASPAAALTKDSFATTLASAMQESGSTHLEMSGTIAGQEISGEGDQAIGKTVADSQVSLQLEALGQPLELRLLDQVVYLNLGPLSQNKFATIDLTDTDNPLVAQFGRLAQQADVSAQIESFEGSVTAFEKVGKRQEIDGVDTQPYDITIDTAKLAKAQGQDASSGLPATVKVTMFVGPDDLPRRLVTGVSGSELTLDFSKWGEDVTVEKPSKDQITDLDLSQLGGGAPTGA